MQSASCVSMKCEPNSFRVVGTDSVDLQVVNNQ